MIFFPIGDSKGVRYRSRPYATIIITLLNVLVYLWELTAPDSGYDEIIRTLGTSPLAVRSRIDLAALSSITATFVHDTQTEFHLHLIGNMVVFWTFGRRVEDACGPFRFTLFYLTSGSCAHLLHLLLTEPYSPIPSIGASGAVAGVMGAYLVLFPGARIRTIFWVVIPIPYPIYMRAFWYLIPWLMFQVVLSVDVVTGADYRVGYLAHLGGFLGALLIFLFLRKDALYRYVTGVDL